MGATDYWEMPGSPTESYDVDTGVTTATRVFSCAWLDRYAVRNYLLVGNAAVYEYDSALWVKRIDMVRYPDTPPVSEGAGNKRVTYEQCQLTANYASANARATDGTAAPGNVTGVALVEQTQTIETQVLSLPNGIFYWDNNTPPSSAVAESQSPEKMVSVKKYSNTYHNCSVLPATFDSLAGKVNIASYKLDPTNDSWTKAIGNILYTGYTSTRSVTGLGTAGWDFTLNFEEIMNGQANNGWNYYYNPNIQDWSRMYNASGTAQEFYPAADFSDLAIPPSILS